MIFNPAYYLALTINISSIYKTFELINLDRITILLLLSLVSQVTNVINRSSLFTKTPVLYNPLLIESDIKALKALFEFQFDCVNSKESSRLFRSTFINASMVSEKSTEIQYEWILIQTNCYRVLNGKFNTTSNL